MTRINSWCKLCDAIAYTECRQQGASHLTHLACRMCLQQHGIGFLNCCTHCHQKQVATLRISLCQQYDVLCSSFCQRSPVLPEWIDPSRVAFALCIHIMSPSGVKNCGRATWSYWDPELYCCVVTERHLNPDTYVYPQLSAALWCRDILTVQAARELNMESECLQCLSPDLRKQFLDNVFLADIAGNSDTSRIPAMAPFASKVAIMDVV